MLLGPAVRAVFFPKYKQKKGKLKFFAIIKVHIIENFQRLHSELLENYTVHFSNKFLLYSVLLPERARLEISRSYVPPSHYLKFTLP